MGINYHRAEFLVSAAKLTQCPAEGGGEVAFAGRSNAGKSSAINALTGSKKLARISKTPGRTQLLNYFSLDDERCLVDLPGYGYAKVPNRIKDEWRLHMDEYLQGRFSLKGVVLLMDIRHPLKDFDSMMLQWAKDRPMPMHILLTKADKLKRGPAKATQLQVQKQLTENYPSASCQLFSSTKKQGLDELKAQLDIWLA